ncbi:hypothetical protein UFOVP380_3 [uncultured Caudovirales phage]|uniref:Uncharacterized protein n=1 Tax=uncultured Caudovirales phage TaxID=2100421 RepID=A0A6J7X215_9CAUD|nr:hypothetical protein UFOVP380_3 [uncultured Caudovirales phage]
MPNPTNSAIIRTWTQTAVDCYLINSDCSRCNIPKLKGLTCLGVLEPCMMGDTVEKLIENSTTGGLRLLGAKQHSPTERMRLGMLLSEMTVKEKGPRNGTAKKTD